MANHYCKLHGEYDDDYSNGCPDCQKAQEYSEEATERAENTRKEMLEKLGELSEQRGENARANREAIERAAFLTNNPGEYECPKCKMISLKNGASCCPKCQKDVPENFWREIRAREYAEAERKKVEAERQREAKKIAAEKHQKWLASPEYALEQKNKQLASEVFARKMARDRFIEKLPKTVGVIFIIIAEIVCGLLMWRYLRRGAPAFPFSGFLGLFIGVSIFPGVLIFWPIYKIGGILGHLIKIIVTKFLK
jgi:uncharacterized Zn finger protein (UPF0148 family)